MVISGYIFDENMKPIVGARISIGGDVVITNVSGAFAIYSGNPLSLMTISKPGYKTAKIIASAFESYAELEWTGELDEAVVQNGYASAPKNDNMMLWILGIAGAAYLAHSMSKPKKVTV